MRFSIKHVVQIAFALLFVLVSMPHSTFAQGYTSTRTGSSTDVKTAHKAGVVLAGGGTDNDDAMRWMLERAAGGDVVVLRTDRTGGYNPYFFTDLGVKLNSVETLVITSTTGAQNPYVAQQIRNAEVLFIAGGDQTTYVRNWKNTPVQDAINYLIAEKKATLGGTSAGMAVLSGIYYAPTASGVVSGEALGNPYHPNMVMLGKNDFIAYPLLKQVLTDTHFEQRDRNGRHFAMLARVQQDWNQPAFGVACNEKSAVCIDENGIGAVFSAGGIGENFVYFTQSNCGAPDSRPETCQTGLPLTWNRNRQAVKALRVTGNASGSAKFDLNTWKPLASNASETMQWENWAAVAGALTRENGSAPCVQAATVSVVSANSRNDGDTRSETLRVRPNPATHEMTAILKLRQASAVNLYVVNSLGQRVATLATYLATSRLPEGTHEFQIPSLVTGSYRCVAEMSVGTEPPVQETWMFVVAH